MFRYARPGTLSEAQVLLEGHGTAAKALAGGTDLFVGLRKGKVQADLVVDLKGVAELAPSIEGDVATGVEIAASTVMTDIVEDERIRTAFPALVEAATQVGSIQIRNRATLAGNMCNASPAADTAPPLLVYDASVVIATRGGLRRVPLADFLVGPGQTALETGELVARIELPARQGPMGSAFARMTRRRGVDLATVSVCCSVSSDGSTRFAVGAAGPRPFVVIDESGVLGDPNSGEAEREELITHLMSAASPISDVRGSKEYRQAMLGVLARRTLQRALAGLSAEGTH